MSENGNLAGRSPAATSYELQVSICHPERNAVESKDLT